MTFEYPEGADRWFEAAAGGVLVAQRCRSCGSVRHYPRKVCSSCGGRDLEWIDCSGRGTVHTFTVIHQTRALGWAERVPYVVAMIDLDEGARLMSNVVGCDPSDVHVGMAVQVVFEKEGDVTLPRFRPA